MAAPKKNARKLKCFVVGGGYEYIKLMYKLGFVGAFSVDEADVVLFTGGEDVDPALYGEKPLKGTAYNSNRDKQEKIIFERARDLEIPMVGICRGGQFLNVMSGGGMWQHVAGHATGGHHARIQTGPLDPKTKKGREIWVTSTHHQMMRPTEEAVILCTASVCLDRMSYEKTEVGRREDGDIEVVFYPTTQALCFQPHPEYSHAREELVDFFQECLDNWVLPLIPSDKTRKNNIEQLRIKAGE